jgi:glucans biosynthesis protein C
MSTTAPNRLAYIDNIRSTMIFLVVMIHAAVTYSHYGRWYYNAPEPIGPLSSLVFGLFQSHLQAFFMGLLFLLAGYFTPTAYDRKDFARFLWDRFVRLGLPTLLFVFVIHDTMGHYLLHWHGSDAFWPSYRYYVFHGDFIDGTGPMWFAVALLVFSFVYALVRLVRPSPAKPRCVPTAAAILAAGAGIGLLTFVVRTVQPVGTAFHNLQLCYFAQYVALFAFGLAARRGDWLAKFPAPTGRRLLIGASILGPVVWFVLMVVGGALTGRMDTLNGGWHWQSLCLSLWEQIFAVAFSTGVIVLFRERFNAGGAFGRLMAENSFAVYVFHTPVLVAISLATASVFAPPLVKAGLVGLAAFVVTVLLTHFVARRIPLLKRIL